MRLHLLLVGALAIQGLLPAHAADPASKPTITRISDTLYGQSLETLSDNGQWAVGYGQSTLVDGGYSFPCLYDVAGKQAYTLFETSEGQSIGEMMACDVTDDGSIVAGQYDGKPAIWRRALNQWEILPVSNKKFTNGQVNKITPDGRYALGTMRLDGGVIATIVLWDLTGAEPADITPANLPLPISHWSAGTLQEYQQLYAGDLSADGSKFTGIVGFSYGGETWTFLYDRTTSGWRGIGLDVTEGTDGDGNAKYTFTPTGTGYSVIEGAGFRPGSDIVYCNAYDEDDEFCIYTFDPATGAVVKTAESSGLKYGTVDGNGTIYAAESVEGPMRNWFFRVGNYWYDFKVVARQLWGIDWQADVTKDDFGLSGTLVTTSADGRVLIANDYSNSPYDSYLIELPESLDQLAGSVNLLGNYTVSPYDYSSFGTLKEVKVTFDRSIEVLGGKTSVQLLDEGGNVVKLSTGVAVDQGDSKKLVVTFRSTRLDDGKTYTVAIPAGTVCVAGDAPRVNEAITLHYTGRPALPVSVVNIAPENGASVTKINASSNPVVLTFDADLAAVSSTESQMYLYRLNDDDEWEEICRLQGSIDGKIFYVYPVMEQRLAKGSKYKIVIAANTVTDTSGADPNEEIVIQYDGSYLPEATDGAILFSDDFNSGISTLKWMYYDGDQLTPAETPANWDFVAGLPWWVIRDNETSTDMAAASHSMYDPAGKSDDWLVTNCIYINDDTAVLSFKAQSYLAAKEDYLKVYVLATEDIYTSLTKSIVDEFREKADLVFDQRLSPGATEGGLDGEWTDYAVDLAAYAGRNVYIAFVNDNDDQSAVFVDDVEVSRDILFSLVNLTPASVLKQSAVTVKGIVTAESKVDEFAGYCLRLLDADGNEVSRLVNADEKCPYGWSMEFTMPDELATPVAKETAYSLEVTLGEVSQTYDFTVQNLAVKTSRKVVIEEFTGQGCPNCPMGHAALEWIEQDFPGQVIPIAIHTYPGDPLSTPKAVQIQEALGFSAAPTGAVNRGIICGPMEVVNGTDYYYKNSGVWYDYVVEALSTLSPADIAIKGATFDGTNYNVSVDVTYALDMEKQNVNIFTAICEDGLVGKQENNRYKVESSALREWGAGGIYGQSTVNNYVFNDVLRTWAGTTFQGTGGYIPSNVEGGKVYNAAITVPTDKRIKDHANTTVTAMLINADTGLVINADRFRIEVSAVEQVSADAEVSVDVADGIVEINGRGPLAADLYTVDGRRIASASADAESLTLDTRGARGIAILRVVTPAGATARKIVL